MGQMTNLLSKSRIQGIENTQSTESVTNAVLSAQRQFSQELEPHTAVIQTASGSVLASSEVQPSLNLISGIAAVALVGCSGIAAVL
eukprot:196849-Amphidinium_carterae.1